MTSEPGPTILREYAFRSGCAAMGCVVIFLCAVGLVSTFAMGFGWMRIQNGEGFQLLLGYAITALCGIGMCALLLAPVMLYYAVQEARRPQFLFVTTTAIQLPSRLVMPQLDEKGRPVPDAPPRQPQVIPFSAIRRIYREDGSGGSQLLFEHDLRPEPLGIAQYLMTPADFEDFVKLLREIVPSAFAAETLGVATGAATAAAPAAPVVPALDLEDAVRTGKGPVKFLGFMILSGLSDRADRTDLGPDPAPGIIGAEFSFTVADRRERRVPPPIAVVPTVAALLRLLAPEGTLALRLGGTEFTTRVRIEPGVHAEHIAIELPLSQGLSAAADEALALLLRNDGLVEFEDADFQ